MRTFILTHEQEATNNLFDMAMRYHDNCPERWREKTAAANANELAFSRMDSGYKIGTAGNKAVGRSATIQLFHGSEVAYWPNAESHAAGVMQAVPLEANTEIWLESTANGENDYFHRQWTMAVRGESGFIPIFVPWFWQPEYAIDGDIVLDSSEQEYAAAHKCSLAQMHWRRVKIVELGGGDLGLDRFKQEYPATPEEAFAGVRKNLIIMPELIRSAIGRKVVPVTRYKPIWGVDVGGDSLLSDRSALAKRNANVLLEPPKVYRGKNTFQLASAIRDEFYNTETYMRPSHIVVDKIGIGAGVVADLMAFDMPGVSIVGINVGETKAARERFRRLRDDLWWRAREWFEALDVSLPSDDVDTMRQFIADMTAPTFENQHNGQTVAESKDDMAKRGIPSPDVADAFNLTFAVSPTERDSTNDRYSRKHSNGGSSWMSA